MNVLSKSEERSSLLQDVDIIGILLAIAPVLLAFIGLIEACETSRYDYKHSFF